MPRSTQDAAITTKAARERLQPRSEPYWRGVEPGIAVGYRKGAKGGTWLARLLQDGTYREQKLGRADDSLPANGADCLDFRQAQNSAVAWASKQRRIAAGLEAEESAPAAPYTVTDAIRDYLLDLGARGSRGISQTRFAAEAHVLPPLGTLPVSRLTRERLRNWHRGLAAAPPRLRPKRGETPRARELDLDDEDAIRRRAASANRVLTILKAALNHARAEGRVTVSSDAWHLVKPFRGADAPKIRYLTDAESIRLVNACSPDFRNLVTGALLTGCRYGELTALRIRDLDLEAGTAFIARSKGGKSRHVVLTPEGVKFFRRLALGRVGSSHVFERDRQMRQATRTEEAETRRSPWAKSDQIRGMAMACKAASIEPAVSFHILRHTHASRLASRGVPMAVIAQQLGHADTRMTERHYAHLAPSYVADTVRAAFGHMGLGDQGDGVVALNPRKNLAD